MTRQQLMDAFRADMARLEPDRQWDESGAYPSFKNFPDTFKYEQHSYLFSVWMAGRSSAGRQE